MGGSPDAAAASLPYSPSSYVPSAQAAGGWQQSAPATTLSLTLVVLIGVCIGGAASALILTCCMVLCNTFRSHLGEPNQDHPACSARPLLPPKLVPVPGDEGPVIAKRVAEDRSASVEAPAPAEHCILVKQASCGGGRLLPPLVRVDLPRQCSWLASALQRSSSLLPRPARSGSLKYCEGAQGQGQQNLGVWLGSGLHTPARQRSGALRTRFLSLQAESGPGACAPDEPGAVERACAEGLAGPAAACVSPFALIQGPLDSDSD